jgi:hypothetical protein
MLKKKQHTFPCLPRLKWHKNQKVAGNFTHRNFFRLQRIFLAAAVNWNSTLDYLPPSQWSTYVCTYQCDLTFCERSAQFRQKFTPNGAILGDIFFKKVCPNHLDDISQKKMLLIPKSIAQMAKLSLIWSHWYLCTYTFCFCRQSFPKQLPRV